MTGEEQSPPSWLRTWSMPLLAPTAAAAVLSGYDLTARSIWLDEASTYAVASQHGAQLWHLLVSAGGNFFLYYPLMHVVISVFGSSLLVLRLPSALAAITTVPVAALLLVRLFDRRAAICGSWLLALSGPLVFWSQQARGYSFAVLFVMTAALGLANAIDGRRRGWWIFVAGAVLAIYTVLLSALAVVALAASVLLVGRRLVRWRPWLFSIGAIVAGSLPLYFLAVRRGTGALDWLGRPGTPDGPSRSYLAQFLLSAKTQTMPVTFASPVVLAIMLAAVVVGVWQLGRNLRRTGPDPTAWSYGLLIAWAVFPPVVAYLTSVVVHPVLEDRYVLTSVPAASMLVGVVISRVEPRAISGALAALLAAALAYQLVPSYGVPLENWKDAEAYVSAHAGPHDCIAMFATAGFDAFDFYVETGSGPTPPAPILPGTTYASHTSFALAAQVFSPTALAHAARTCRTVWLVRSHASTQPPPAGTAAYERLTYRRYQILRTQISTSFRQVASIPFKAVVVVLYRPRAGQLAGSGAAGG